MEYEEIHWSCGSLEEARQASRTLVENKLVACAQIIPWIESIYLWNHALETAQESKVIFKALTCNRKSIIERLQEISSYEVPEILVVPIVDGNADYLEWMRENSSSCVEES